MSPAKPKTTDVAQRAPRPKRWQRVVAFVLVQGLLVFVFLEVFGRWLDPLGVSYYPETARYLRTMIREEPIGYRNRPGLEGKYWGAEVRINAMGLRDDEVAARKPGEVRTLVLGDSFPFGVGVDAEQSIPGRLEAMLQEHYGERAATVFNMGVVSYNTEQELEQLRTVGLELDPDLLVLYYIPNDIEPKTWVFDKRKSRVVRLVERSYALTLLFVLSRRVRAATSGPSRAIHSPAYDEDHPRWREIAAQLGQIASIANERSIPLAVVTQFDADDEVLLPRFRRMGADHGWLHANLRPMDDPRWADRPDSDLINSVVDSHPNPEGCIAHATLLYEALRSGGLLDRAAGRRAGAPVADAIDAVSP